jgi:endonuclease/exonuclease/phosphatase family metal-dependent hydrolase
MLHHEAKRNASIIMGDMNAKIGANNMGKEEIMGKEGLGSMNENGELFTDFCARNQIYHIAISRQWRRSILDIRVMRGADTASDYLLVRGVVKIKLAAIRPSKRRKRYNVERLKDPETAKKFAEELRIKQASLNTN